MFGIIIVITISITLALIGLYAIRGVIGIELDEEERQHYELPYCFLEPELRMEDL